MSCPYARNKEQNQNIMPVVIQEIQINVEVSNTTSTKQASVNRIHDSGNEKQEIISECVQEVLRILKEKEER